MLFFVLSYFNTVPLSVAIFTTFKFSDFLATNFIFKPHFLETDFCAHSAAICRHFPAPVFLKNAILLCRHISAFTVYSVVSYCPNRPHYGSCSPVRLFVRLH